MKLINYNYGYQDKFNCGIHGKITMTYAEWVEAMRFCYSTFNKKTDYFYNFDADLLIHDMCRKQEIKGGFRINVRVPLTEMLVTKYNLKNYKRGNYMLEVREVI